MKKGFVSLQLGFGAWCAWYVADQPELPFLVRCIAFANFVLSVVTIVSVWYRKP